MPEAQETMDKIQKDLRAENIQIRVDERFDKRLKVT